jgi:hypothetical protein
MGTPLLGISSSIIDIDPAHLDAIDTQDLFIPDKFYVINFERPHNYGPITMTIGSAASKYYQAWDDYGKAILYNGDEFSRLSAYVTSQIEWRQVIAPMLSESVEYDGRVACSVIRCYSTGFKDTICLYLLINDPAALVELGANSDDVSKLRSMIPDQEQKYIQRMYNRYKGTYLTEENASDWDKMWMAYFGFEFYVPPPPPPPPKSLAEQINENRDVIYKEPLVRMGSGVGVKGHFAYVSYVDSPNESVFKSYHPNIYITNVFYGVKSISDVAFWRITGVWRFLENQNEVIIDGWRWNGVYLWQSRHLQLIHDAVVRLKGMWVYCDEAFYKLFNYFKDQSTSVQYRVFSGFYGSDIQSLRMRTYLDQHKRMVVTNHKRFAFVDVSTFTLSGSTPGVLFGDLRLLKLSANDVFDGFNSEPLNLPG